MGNVIKVITGQILYDMYVGDMRIDDVLKYAREQNIDSPVKPRQPVLSRKHTAEELGEYTAKFNMYDLEMKAYDKTLLVHREKYREIATAEIEFVKLASDFYSIPKRYQEKVWMKAWEDGHSSGLYSVFQELEELVDIFSQ